MSLAECRQWRLLVDLDMMQAIPKGNTPMEEKQTREWRGSVCVGLVTSRWPFGKMTLSLDRIELTCLLGCYSLPREDVRSIERGKLFPWLWMGIRINHARDGYPARLMFSPLLFWRRGQILHHAERLGYKVS